jgi:uncharacterized membrane protein YphA (DoxX/SURF4 family)
MLLAFIALMLLRVMVGFHFYSEGTTKLQSNGAWTSEYFLRGAKGPFAPMFQGMLEDESGVQRLCMTQVETEDGEMKWDIDTTLTESLWEDFLHKAAGHYNFNDPAVIEGLQKQRDDLKQQIANARESQNKNINTTELEQLRKGYEASIKSIRTQVQDADAIFEGKKEELEYWLAINRTDLLAHFNTNERLDGFQRDGENRKRVALQVESLRDQVGTVRSDRQKKLNGWYAEVQSMWDSLEDEVNQLAVDPQTESGRVELHRPFDQSASKLKVVDQFIPWFDTIVGVLLILGLFTRFASLSAALFLGSVLLSQPFWIPDAKPTFYESVEFFALLVIFATCAGRFGGLDFFLSQKNKETSEVEQ